MKTNATHMGSSHCEKWGVAGGALDHSAEGGGVVPLKPERR